MPRPDAAAINTAIDAAVVKVKAFISDHIDAMGDDPGGQVPEYIFAEFGAGDALTLPASIAKLKVVVDLGRK